MNDTSTLTLPVLPLANGAVLPQMVITIALESDEAKAAAEAAGDEGRLLLLPRIDGRYATVGVLAQIESSGILPSGVEALVVRGIQRARVGAGVVGTTASLWLEAEPLDDGPPTDETRQLATEVRAAARALFGGPGNRRLAEMLRAIDDPATLADSAGWWPDLSVERKVELLQTLPVAERLQKVLSWLKEALAEIELTERIRSDVSEGMEKTQREYILRQQLEAIRRELGDSGDDDDLVETYRNQLSELVPHLSEATHKAIAKEIDRFAAANPQAMEHGWIRTWLDTILGLPWAERTEDNLDLAAARQVLDDDHAGLDEVKDRIIEFLAVRKLRAERGTATADAEPSGSSAGANSSRRGGAIVALVGPPGVGKTSLGESVARALGRKFVRVALGGVRDEAEIRGHRRTYVGAQSGRIARALQEAGTMNPVFLLDELDKVGSDWRGDASAALLEVLDPAQNHSFRDHYLEVELDLSDVLFITTANVLDTIPGPLLDRMEVVRLDGYTDEEKVTIARQHLLPQQEVRNGLLQDEVVITDDALLQIVAEYTREAGVRGLERQLGKVLRKAAVKVAADPSVAPLTIDIPAVTDALGRPRLKETLDAARKGVPGVATGLAVTGAGGDVLYVEATVLGDAPDPDQAGSGGGAGGAATAHGSGGASLTITGQLGDVMKESAQIALSYVQSRRAELGIAAGADQRRFHIHFPSGAVPKDGPSAGVTMVTALVSLLTGTAVRPDLAMTGEISLHGRVLPIGGVKQKVLAAHRAGLTHVVLPHANGPDLEDVPEAVREAMTFHLAQDASEVLAAAFSPLVDPA